MVRSLIVIILAFLIVSCSSQKNVSPIPSVSEQARHHIDKPVNCNTARNDIAILEDEKASVGKQVLSGVRSVMPIAAVAGLLTGDYSDRVEVTTGQYNEDIEAKIAQIRNTCHVY